MSDQKINKFQYVKVGSLRTQTFDTDKKKLISVCGTTVEVRGQLDGADVCGRTTSFDDSSKHETTEGWCRHSQRSVQAGTKNLQKSYR